MSSIDLEEVAGVVGDLDRATDVTERAVGLPRECYVSESFHDFERVAVYERSWLGLGRVEQVPEPGDYFSITVCGEPLLVVRAEDGGINVLSNVCPHRHHLVAEGAGTSEGLLRCPLHSWGFDLAGTLVRATGMAAREDFDASAHCLPRLRLEIWNGFIFANHDPQAEPLAPRLANVEAAAAEHHLSELVTTEPIDTGPFPWNWKTMHENGIEPFHAKFLHKGQHDFAPRPEFCEWSEGDAAVMHPTWFKEMDQSFNPIWRNLLDPLPDLSEDQRRQVMFVSLPPTLYFGLMPDHVFWMLILPLGAGRIELRNGILHHPDATALPNFPERVDWMVQGLLNLFAEDSAANTSVQLGRGSRYATPGPYASEEATLPQMNRLLAALYRQGFEDLRVERPVSIADHTRSTPHTPTTAIA